MKKLEIVIEDDGKISVDGAPVASIDEALDLVKGAAGGGEVSEETPAPEIEAPEAEGGEAAAEAMPPMPEGGEAAPEAGAKPSACSCGKPGCDGSCGAGKSARFARKSGMQPKEKASFEDYFTKG